MGLYVHSLDRLPTELDRDFYVYVLDYGWDEPLAAALHSNFRRMADFAARNKAVVIAGTEPRNFTNEIISVHMDSSQFSWASVNGERGEVLVRGAHARGGEDEPHRALHYEPRLPVCVSAWIRLTIR